MNGDEASLQDRHPSILSLCFKQQQQQNQNATKFAFIGV